MLHGDLCVAFLMPLDVGCECIPDQVQPGIGSASVFPGGHDDGYIEGYLDIINFAAAGAFQIVHRAAKADFGGSGVSRAGSAGVRTLGFQLVVQLWRGSAVDGEVTGGFANNRFRTGLMR